MKFKIDKAKEKRERKNFNNILKFKKMRNETRKK